MGGWCVSSLHQSVPEGEHLFLFSQLVFLLGGFSMERMWRFHSLLSDVVESDIPPVAGSIVDMVMDRKMPLKITSEEFSGGFHGVRKNTRCSG